MTIQARGEPEYLLEVQRVGERAQHRPAQEFIILLLERLLDRDWMRGAEGADEIAHRQVRAAERLVRLAEERRTAESGAAVQENDAPERDHLHQAIVCALLRGTEFGIHRRVFVRSA